MQPIQKADTRTTKKIAVCPGVILVSLEQDRNTATFVGEPGLIVVHIWQKNLPA